MEICRNFAALNGGTVAQLVEQRTENPRVTGSIPVGTTHIRDASDASLFLYAISNLGHMMQNKKKRLRLETLFR